MPLFRRLAAVAAAGAVGAGAGILWASSRPRASRNRPQPLPPPGLPPARIVNVPGVGEMFVREAGSPDKPTVLLLHGWMFPADLNWWTCYGPLSEIAHVVAPDHRGHGRGLRPSEPFRLADAADDAAALLRHLDVGPAVAVGYSMGGAVAQLLWRRHPDLVRGLVLCATSSSWTSPRMRLAWRGMGFLQVLLRLVPRMWWESLYEAQLRGGLPIPVTRMINDETPEAVGRFLPWIVAELDRGSAEDLAEGGREMSRYDARAWLGEVDVPAGVIVTTHDVLVPPDLQHDLAGRIPGARTWRVRGDHDSVVSKADRFVPTLVDAVNDVLARSHAGTDEEAAPARDTALW